MVSSRYVHVHGEVFVRITIHETVYVSHNLIQGTKPGMTIHSLTQGQVLPQVKSTSTRIVVYCEVHPQPKTQSESEPPTLGIFLINRAAQIHVHVRVNL